MGKCWINLPVLLPREILWEKNGENCRKIIEKNLKIQIVAILTDQSEECKKRSLNNNNLN